MGTLLWEAVPLNMLICLVVSLLIDDLQAHVAIPLGQPGPAEAWALGAFPLT
jgi:hypothetical protein